jgi:hypothetical protein
VRAPEESSVGAPEEESSVGAPEEESSVGAPDEASSVEAPEEASSVGAPEEASSVGAPEEASSVGAPPPPDGDRCRPGVGAHDGAERGERGGTGPGGRTLRSRGMFALLKFTNSCFLLGDFLAVSVGANQK